MEKNKGNVDDVESFKRRNCIVQESEDDPGESEASGDRMSRYSSSSINDELPELVVFLQETNYEFVKDICIDKAGTSCEECFEENCDTQNGYVPCMLKSNVVEKNLLNKVNENQKFCYDAKDDIPSDFSNKKSVPKLHLDRKVTGKRVAASSNSIAISLTKILDENKLKGKGVAGSNNEHGNVFHDSGLPPSGVGGGGRTSTAKDYAPENQTGRYRSIYGFVYQRDDVTHLGRMTAPIAHILLLFQFYRQNGTEAQKEWRPLSRGKREGCNCGGYVFPAAISEHLIAQPAQKIVEIRRRKNHYLGKANAKSVCLGSTRFAGVDRVIKQAGGRVMESKDHHQPPPCANPESKARHCSANATINCHLNYEC
ncbi:hypothetical protein SDJN03_16171, partial [Cucurbita argyrosperma subsp. sororia]